MLRTCDEPTCANPLPPSGRAVRFCSRSCKELSHNREKVRGAQLLRIAMRLRQDRRPDHKAGTKVAELRTSALPVAARKAIDVRSMPTWTAVTRLVDTFLREDRAMREAACAHGA